MSASRSAKATIRKRAEDEGASERPAGKRVKDDGKWKK
jgi:hypothetical protein